MGSRKRPPCSLTGSHDHDPTMFIHRLRAQGSTCTASRLRSRPERRKWGADGAQARPSLLPGRGCGHVHRGPPRALGDRGPFPLLPHAPGFAALAVVDPTPERARGASHLQEVQGISFLNRKAISGWKEALEVTVLTLALKTDWLHPYITAFLTFHHPP